MSTGIIVLTVFIFTLTGFVVWQSYLQYRAASRALQANRMAGIIVTTAGMYATERGMTSVALGLPPPVNIDIPARIGKLRRQSNQLWNRTLHVAHLIEAGLSGDTEFTTAINRATESHLGLQTMRHRIDRRLSGKDEDVAVLDWISTITDVIGSEAGLWRTAFALPDTPYEIARFNLTLRQWTWLTAEYAGLERGVMGYFVTTRQPVPPAILDEIMEYRGVVKRNVGELLAIKGESNTDPRIARAITEMEEIFLPRFEQTRAAIHAAANGKYSMNTEEWWARETEGIDSVLAVATAITEVSNERAAEVVSSSMRRVILFTVLAGVTFILALVLLKVQARLRTSLSELKRKESRIKLLMESVGEGIYGIDLRGDCLFANTACAQMLEFRSPDELLGRNMHRLMHHSHQDGSVYPQEDCNICKAYREGISAHADNEVFWRQDGVSFPVEYRSQPIIYEGRTLGSVVSFADISERKKVERKLRDAHEELEDKVLQRTEALSRAKDEAEMANRAKTVFLASMSHELRPPLNAILGFAQLLELDTDQLNEAQCEALEHILSGGRHLLELINDVLDLAKIESGHLTLSIEDVPVRTILEDAVQITGTMAAENAIHVEINCPEAELPLIRADHVRLKQVVLNFLTNAIKYNRRGGRVTVEFEEIPGRFLRILVNDTGMGIPAGYQRELFKPFSRLGAEAGAIEGTGVGLAISRELIKLMEGNLGFESVEGQGSTFWFELPLARGLESNGNTVMTGHRNPATPAFPEVRKVLYVEDNPANLRLMKTIIAQIPGLQCIAAHTAELGLVLAQRDKPDLILMDINLPGMDGHEALRKLKQNADTADIPVVAVTANAMCSQLEEAEKSAFASYITKPFNVAEIVKSIKHLVKL